MGKKIIGSAGRFGVRYGQRIRQKVSDIEKKEKQKHECPHCHKKNVKRVSVGIWKCNTCNAKFTGRAYVPGE